MRTSLIVAILAIVFLVISVFATLPLWVGVGFLAVAVLLLAMGK